MASSTSGVSSPTGGAVGARRAAERSGRRLGIGLLERASGYGCEQPGPARRDPGATPLAAAGQAGQAEPVVGGDDGRPAEGQLAGPARARPAGGCPGGSSPTSMARARASASCSLRGSAPSAQGPISSTSVAAETIDCLFSPLGVGLAIGLVVSCACQYASHNSPMSTDGPRDRVDWTGKEGRPHDDRSGRGRPRGGRSSSARSSRSRLAAIRFGVDSRPGIGDRDRRPWLVRPLTDLLRAGERPRPRPGSFRVRRRLRRRSGSALGGSQLRLRARACRPGRTPGPRANRRRRASGAWA